ALSLAHCHGFVRTIVDEGPPMAELLGELLRLRREDGLVPLSYLNHLVSALQPEVAHAPQTARVTIPRLVVPLPGQALAAVALPARRPTHRTGDGSPRPPGGGKAQSGDRRGDLRVAQHDEEARHSYPRQARSEQPDRSCEPLPGIGAHPLNLPDLPPSGDDSGP